MSDRERVALELQELLHQTPPLETILLALSHSEATELLALLEPGEPVWVSEAALSVAEKGQGICAINSKQLPGVYDVPLYRHPPGESEVVAYKHEYSCGHYGYSGDGGEGPSKLCQFLDGGVLTVIRPLTYAQEPDHE